jgi:hypothetical protein
MADDIEFRIIIDMDEARRRREEFEKNADRKRDERDRQQERQDERRRERASRTAGSLLGAVPFVGGQLQAGAEMMNRFGPEFTGAVAGLVADRLPDWMKAAGVDKEAVSGALKTANENADLIGEIEDRLNALQQTVAISAAVTAAGSAPNASQVAQLLALTQRTETIRRTFDRQIRQALTAQTADNFANSVTKKTERKSTSNTIQGSRKGSFKGSHR